MHIERCIYKILLSLVLKSSRLDENFPFNHVSRKVKRVWYKMDSIKADYIRLNLDCG